MRRSKLLGSLLLIAFAALPAGLRAQQNASAAPPSTSPPIKLSQTTVWRFRSLFRRSLINQPFWFSRTATSISMESRAFMFRE
jgi:hypothetical protein